MESDSKIKISKKIEQIKFGKNSKILSFVGIYPINPVIEVFYSFYSQSFYQPKRKPDHSLSLFNHNLSLFIIYWVTHFDLLTNCLVKFI
jgi:hypothetical protein